MLTHQKDVTFWKVLKSHFPPEKFVSTGSYISPVTTEQFLNHTSCGVNAQLVSFRQWGLSENNLLIWRNYLSQSEKISPARRSLFVGSPISKTRLIWLKQAIMLPDKGPNSRGGKRNFMGRRLYSKWHFCAKGGFLEECPCWKEPSWRMDRARLQSGVLSHKWKIRLRLLGRISASRQEIWASGGAALLEM